MSEHDPRRLALENVFGKVKEYSRADFVAKWGAHAIELASVMEPAEVLKIKERVEECAGKEWDEMYARQERRKKEQANG